MPEIFQKKVTGDQNEELDELSEQEAWQNIGSVSRCSSLSWASIGRWAPPLAA